MNYSLPLINGSEMSTTNTALPNGVVFSADGKSLEVSNGKEIKVTLDKGKKQYTVTSTDTEVSFTI